MSLNSMIETLKRRKVDKNLTKLDVRLKKGQITFDEALYRESLLFMRGIAMLEQANENIFHFVQHYNDPKNIELLTSTINGIVDETYKPYAMASGHSYLNMCGEKATIETIKAEMIDRVFPIACCASILEDLEKLAKIEGIELDMNKLYDEDSFAENPIISRFLEHCRSKAAEEYYCEKHPKGKYEGCSLHEITYEEACKNLDGLSFFQPLMYLVKLRRNEEFCNESCGLIYAPDCKKYLDVVCSDDFYLKEIDYRGLDY